MSRILVTYTIKIIVGLGMGASQDNHRSKALESALSQIERAFGKGSVMRLGQKEQAVEAEVISTGSLGLDIALGVGAFLKGRIIEIYGPESSGKTTMAIHVVAEAAKIRRSLCICGC